jgi:hypothetical protein
VSRLQVHLPLTAGAARARLYAAGVVISELSSEQGFELTVDIPVAERGLLERIEGARIIAL